MAAVAATTFASVTLGDAVARKGFPSCPAAAVRTERMPLVASGFAPGSKVTVSAGVADLGYPTSRVVRADTTGQITTMVGVPADAVIGVPTVFRVDGTNAAGGTAVGVQSVAVTADPTCVQRVRDAGLLGGGSGS